MSNYIQSEGGIVLAFLTTLVGGHLNNDNVWQGGWDI